MSLRRRVSNSRECPEQGVVDEPFWHLWLDIVTLMWYPSVKLEPCA
jgi:hypothetical protein